MNEKSKRLLGAGLRNDPRNDLGRAIYALLTSPKYIQKYPNGATAHEILGEIRGFPLCSWMDVYDELQYMYDPKE